MIRHSSAGIDVSAEWFDVHLLSSKQDKRFDYTESGLSALVIWLDEQGPGPFHVGMEATGRLEIQLARLFRSPATRCRFWIPFASFATVKAMRAQPRRTARTPE